MSDYETICEQQIKARDAEIDRLRRDIDEQRRLRDHFGDRAAKYHAELDRLRRELAEARELLREARDDVAECANHTHKPPAVEFYRNQLAAIDAFLAAEKEGER
jgi:septal ring factor EnvC (AmiA/AmiB activator)